VSVQVLKMRWRSIAIFLVCAHFATTFQTAHNVLFESQRIIDTNDIPSIASFYLAFQHHVGIPSAK
jgi:hypothetical protein